MTPEPILRGERQRLEEIRREVGAGLSLPQKELPPKFFYDERGSRLFEEITELPEYYLTRTERFLLQRWMPAWMDRLRPRSLVELGAGSATKTRIILDAMGAAREARCYVPVDISAEFLGATAEALRAEYPRLATRPLVADISEAVHLPEDLPRPALFAFVGSTIGNFSPAAAERLLRGVRAEMRPDDHFLLGVDLRKDPAVLEAAYNDARGATAEFNLNMLRVLNSEAGTDFDPGAFRHLAFYNGEEHRIEMHLVSTRPQRVTVPGEGVWDFAEGETLRTEISCKHDLDSVRHMLRAAGLQMTAWETDPDGYYALVLAAPAPDVRRGA